MTVNEAHLIYFSPTHTSKHVAEAIVHGTGIKNIIHINVTQQIADEIVIPASASVSYTHLDVYKRQGVDREQELRKQCRYRY